MATTTATSPKTGIRQLNKLIDKLKALEVVLKIKITDIIEREKPAILEINRQYLEEGKKPDGKEISSKGYSPAYTAYKEKYGRYKNTSHVDLKLTGAFHNSFQLNYKGDLTWQFEASDYKYEFLKKYGELLGLNENDWQDFANEILLPELTEFLTEYFEL